MSYFSNLVDSKLSGKSKDSDFEYFRQKQLLLRKPKSSSPPKEAGVTLLCYPKAGLMHLALMKRPTYSGVHSGQISLPGGKKEDTDGDGECPGCGNVERHVYNYSCGCHIDAA